MVAFGNPFPRRDNKGAEIIPPWQSKFVKLLHIIIH